MTSNAVRIGAEGLVARPTSLLAASVGVVYYQHAVSSEQKIEKLQDEKRQLEQVVRAWGLRDPLARGVVSRTDERRIDYLESLLPRRSSAHSISMSRKCDSPFSSVYKL